MARYGIKIARTRSWVAKGSKDNDLRFTENKAEAQRFTSADHANKLAFDLFASNRHLNLVSAVLS
jgi:hypothetical protein